MPNLTLNQPSTLKNVNETLVDSNLSSFDIRISQNISNREKHQTELASAVVSTKRADEKGISNLTSEPNSNYVTVAKGGFSV